MDLNITSVMSKMKNRNIPVYMPFLHGNEKKYVNECLDSTWISSKGQYIDRFEASFVKYIGAKFATSVSNGTVAIHLVLEALGIGPGDEVIVPTLTYIASVNTIIQTGAKPIFVDSIAGTWQMDPCDVNAKISERTKAILAVHLYGQACDMDPLMEICHNHKLLLIEDCAEAFGSKYKGRYVGTFGDAATFSFFGNKTITTGEGGMVVAREKKTIERAFHLKNQGVSKDRQYWHDCIAYNYRMTNICAAIGLAQLEQADVILEKKRKIAEIYKNELKNLPVVFHDEQAESVHSFWMCSILAESTTKRDGLREFLMKNGVETRPVFFPAHTMDHCRQDSIFPIAAWLSSTGINLPSYPDLHENDIKTICELINQYYRD